jgi:hypothetical protein
MVPGYGEPLVQIMISLFPGYHGTSGLGPLLTAAGYVMVDATIWAAVLAWLYNRAVSR